MAREFNLEVEGCSLWWLDVTSGHKGLKEIQTNLDALSMALSVGSSKEIIVYIKINSRGHAHGVGPSSEKGKNILEDEDQEEGEELDEESTDVEGELLGRDVRGKKDADDSYFHDSDYTFSDSEQDGNDTSDRSKVIVSVGPTMQMMKMLRQIMQVQRSCTLVLQLMKMIWLKLSLGIQNLMKILI